MPPDGWTDRRTDRPTWWFQYTPLTSLRGYKNSVSVALSKGQPCIYVETFEENVSGSLNCNLRRQSPKKRRGGVSDRSYLPLRVASFSRAGVPARECPRRLEMDSWRDGGRGSCKDWIDSLLNPPEPLLPMMSDVTSILISGGGCLLVIKRSLFSAVFLFMQAINFIIVQW